MSHPAAYKSIRLADQSTDSDKAAPYGIVEAMGRVSSRFSPGTAAIETAVDRCAYDDRDKQPESQAHLTTTEDQHEDRRDRRHRPDRLEDRRHSAPGRPRGPRRLAQHRRQYHHRRGAQGRPGRRTGRDRPGQFTLI